MNSSAAARTKPIRLMLVDDHVVMREALRDSLLREERILVVAEAGDGKAALQMLPASLPDLVLTDIAMPGMDGVELTEHIGREFPSIRVLALSTYMERQFIQRMLDAGAAGYVSKSAGREELLQGIESVARGKSYLCQECAVLLARSPTQESPPRLGHREVEILKMIAQGSSSSDIARQLFIATGTVEVHRRNILRKLDLHDVAGLTRYAIREGLIAP